MKKKSRMLSLMQEKRSFYTLKELEKLGSSRGIVYQSVKEVVLMSVGVLNWCKQTVARLVAEDLIKQDKVGTQSLCCLNRLHQKSCENQILGTQKRFPDVSCS
eukprot:GHVN01023817.1.p1 GENE.GHVN01023817.1~~GHVN01023817.1.p1  ORF type:complete len:103 (+),score=9.87 GHVN01023817.1:36-344(+)